MALRITTWNVNGIRNPFGYHPWSQHKSYQRMFDTLEADIICFQETKIQPKDLTDDMVLVPGFDSYFTFPRQKKGYSGVAIYTRNSKCTPIRAEEGITGALESLSHPGKSYRLLDADECIGGYPDLSKEEAAKLDSEGRALVLDFGSFVLIGAYCPAATDPSRDHFRACFVEALCTRVRKLVNDLKRRVVVVGDLNIARDEMDACDAHETIKEGGLNAWKDTLTRASLDRLLLPHPNGVMADLCRERFPDRMGMFTCWDVKKNKRPGNAGSRIDYILCSPNMRNWFGDVNIQEGLMGSDHCPVYGTIHATVDVEGTQRSIIDISSPEGMFQHGVLQPSFTAPPLPRLCRKRFPEYSQRQSIKGMFARISSASKRSRSDVTVDNRPTSIKNLINPPDEEDSPVPPPKRARKSANSNSTNPISNPTNPISNPTNPISNPTNPTSTKGNAAKPALAKPKATKKKVQVAKGGDKPQPGIRDFMQPVGNEVTTGSPTRDAPTNGSTSPNGRQPAAGYSSVDAPSNGYLSSSRYSPIDVSSNGYQPPTRRSPATPLPRSTDPNQYIPVQRPFNTSPISQSMSSTPQSESSAMYPPERNQDSYPNQSQGNAQPYLPTPSVSDGFCKTGDSLQEWRAIFQKKPPPVCDMHREHCVRRVARKAGPNEGRAFWVCARPIGPNGESAVRAGVRSEWQCNFFKWFEREG